MVFIKLMMKYLVDSETSWLMVSTNHESISLLQRTQIADKDAVLTGLLLQMSDMLAYSTLVTFNAPQAQILEANSSQPSLITVSHAHHWDYARSFSIN